MMKLIPESVTRGIGSAILSTKTNSPHIFFVGGVVGAVAGTVLACRATLKLEPVLENIQNDLNTINETAKPLKASVDTEYDEKERLRQLGHAYGRGAIEIGKLYGPAALVGAASIFALTGSHVQLTRRNSALTATVAMLSKAYNDYRERVREELGEERERELYQNVQLVEKTVDGKKQLVKAVDPRNTSPYARFFDATSTKWEKNPEINKFFLKCQEDMFNTILHARGYVFLNEVYESLGFNWTQAGQTVGWLANSQDGDGYISFDLHSMWNIRALDEQQPSFLLDFNVDGPIAQVALEE